MSTCPMLLAFALMPQADLSVFNEGLIDGLPRLKLTNPNNIRVDYEELFLRLAVVPIADEHDTPEAVLSQDALQLCNRRGDYSRQSIGCLKLYLLCSIEEFVVIDEKVVFA